MHKSRPYYFQTYRSTLAGLGGSCLQPTYRCVKCHRYTPDLYKMNRHMRWRWLTDLFRKFPPE